MAGEKSEKDLYFNVEGVKYEDVAEMYSKQHMNKCNELHGMLKHSTKTQLKVGKEVTVNNQKIALFKYKGLIYATDSVCPHMGGPLHLGDIEELGEAKNICIVCPWHSWKFSLTTGEIKAPIYQNAKVTVYPVQVKEDGSLFIAFDYLSPDYFNGIVDF